jgi:Holliday junction resolvase
MKHAELQKQVKNIFEKFGFFVIENVEHKKTRSSGIPDMQAIKNGYTVFVEIKTGRDQLRESQIEFRNKLVQAGANWTEIRSVTQAVEYIQKMRHDGFRV